MSLSPDTLVEESEEEKSLRQRRTGVFGNGLYVLCRPDPYDPEIYRRQSRAVCLTKPYLACPTCPHSRFTLFFDANSTARFQTVQCPKWGRAGDRAAGRDPESYRTTEVATCEIKPFEFCPSCPSQQNLVQIGADKQVDGWYGRWNRIEREAREDG